MISHFLVSWSVLLHNTEVEELEQGECGSCKNRGYPFSVIGECYSEDNFLPYLKYLNVIMLSHDLPV